MKFKIYEIIIATKDSLNEKNGEKAYYKYEKFSIIKFFGYGVVVSHTRLKTVMLIDKLEDFITLKEFRNNKLNELGI